MKKRYEFWLTLEQENKLAERTKALGFTKKSDYLRFVALMELSFTEKIDQIHKKVCGENGSTR